MSDLAALDEYLRTQGVEHFTAHEIAPVGRHAGFAILKMPPESLWPNIMPTLRVLEELREHFGHPVECLSGYRDPAYNTAVGGERESLHLAFNAVDFRCEPVKERELALWLHHHPLAKKLGIGCYAAFVHVDTRGTLKRKAPARWAGDNQRWWD